MPSATFGSSDCSKRRLRNANAPRTDGSIWNRAQSFHITICDCDDVMRKLVSDCDDVTLNVAGLRFGFVTCNMMPTVPLQLTYPLFWLLFVSVIYSIQICLFHISFCDNIAVDGSHHKCTMPCIDGSPDALSFRLCFLYVLECLSAYIPSPFCFCVRICRRYRIDRIPGSSNRQFWTGHWGVAWCRRRNRLCWGEPGRMIRHHRHGLIITCLIWCRICFCFISFCTCRASVVCGVFYFFIKI